jgi:hypothetical protein
MAFSEVAAQHHPTSLDVCESAHQLLAFAAVVS